MSKYHYIVNNNRLLTPTVRSVVLTPEKDQRPLLFEPGQYASLSLHDRWRPTMARCFSIASSPLDKDHLEFAARVGGSYTAALERLKPGDPVVIRGPFGQFTLREETQPALVFLAGGIGVTPFMSMMRYATGRGLPNRMHLIFSCRSQDEIPYFDELVALQRKNCNLRVTFVIAGGDTSRLRGCTVLTGQVNQTLLPYLSLDTKRETYMICGPGVYISALQTLLEENGVPAERILSESFTQGAKRESSTLTRWPANTYALGGVSMLLAGFYVVTTDLSQTLPKLEAGYQPADTVPGIVVEGGSGNFNTHVLSTPPQVDTSIVFDPTPKPSVSDTLPVIDTTPTPVPTPTPIPTPTPTPVPTPAPAICTSFTYSSWGACLSTGKQARTVLSVSPSGCTGGSPVTVRSCTYTPPTTTTTSRPRTRVS